MANQERSTPRYIRHNAEEDRAWFHLYRGANQPSVAHEVVQHLDSDPEAKRCHLALYLRCRETLRAHRARQMRNQRIGTFVRTVLVAIFVMPLQCPALVRLAQRQACGGTSAWRSVGDTTARAGSSASAAADRVLSASTTAFAATSSTSSASATQILVWTWT